MSPAKNWVDFKEVREKIDFASVLEAYGVKLRLRGPQHHGFCPLPDHDGQKRSPSFSAHLEKKAFHCFGCQAHGNVIDFVALMESLDPNDPQHIRRAALMLQERFLGGVDGAPSPGRPFERRVPTRAKQAESSPREAPPQVTPRASPRSIRRLRFRSRSKAPPRQPMQATSTPKVQPTETPSPPALGVSDTRPRIINAPLDFELKNIDPDHPFLKQRGLTPETIRTFGLGYSNRGLMGGRIAIPLHDLDGRLIGYAGRLVDDSRIGEENPKYRLPGSRERDGTVYEFRKGAFLFNAHRIQAPVTDLIVVEGFFSVFHLWQCGFRNAVALMGGSCSPEQADLIVRLTTLAGRICLMPDGDKAGEQCAESLLFQLAPHRMVKWARLAEGEDIDPLEPQKIAALLTPHV